MTRRIILTDRAPKPIGPYSQAVLADGWLFCSGQIALDPATGQMVVGDVRAQADRVLRNLQAVVEVAGGSLRDVVKTTIFLKSIDDFPAVNEVYATFFPADPPARSTVQAARLPKDALVEIEAVARLAP
jgi:2-iminobutanoate/2-iminopropanoate deaminase